MRKITYLILAASILATSCKKKNDDPPPAPVVQTAKVKFTNACFSSGQIKARISDTAVSAVTGIDYLASTGYVGILPGTDAKTEFLLASDLTLTQTTATYAVNNNYSVFATGIVTNPSILVTPDDLTAPAAGKAKVRFINLCLNDPKETAYVGTTRIDTNSSYKTVSPFVEITAGTYAVNAIEPGNIPLNQTLPGQVFTAGKIYTLILRGTTDNNAASLGLTLIQNN